MCGESEIMFFVKVMTYESVPDEMFWKIQESFGELNVSFFQSCCVTSFRTSFEDPLPSLYWWAVSVGGDELKWHHLAHHQLMSQTWTSF